MKETKNATIRLPQEIADWLTKDGKSITATITAPDLTKDVELTVGWQAKA